MSGLNTSVVSRRADNIESQAFNRGQEGSRFGTWSRAQVQGLSPTLPPYSAGADRSKG